MHELEGCEHGSAYPIRELAFTQDVGQEVICFKSDGSVTVSKISVDHSNKPRGPHSARRRKDISFQELYTAKMTREFPRIQCLEAAQIKKIDNHYNVVSTCISGFNSQVVVQSRLHISDDSCSLVSSAEKIPHTKACCISMFGKMAVGVPGGIVHSNISSNGARPRWYKKEVNLDSKGVKSDCTALSDCGNVSYIFHRFS